MHIAAPRRARALLAGAAALALLTGPVAPSAAGASTPPAPTGRPDGATHTVTLLTGDVVRVTEMAGGKQLADVRRPAGATGGVHAHTIGKNLHVVPDEALPYLASGRLDRRLFDVTSLIAQGYDDAHSDGIPLIVSYGPQPRAARAAPPAAPAGTTVSRHLPSINGASVRAPKQRARDVWKAVAPVAVPSKLAALGDGVAKIWLDGKVKASMAESAAQVGAPAAWAAGYTGTGVKVAVLDTGADQAHPDLAGRVSLAISFVPGESTVDNNGHGTHVASTIGGSGAASGGTERGIAPGADLIVGKVLGDSGFGEDSWVIAGMEWAAAQGADVVNMSLGGSMPTDGTDPMSLALNQLTASTGTLFVVAAGNSGVEASMSPPGTADAALTVGAVDSADQLAYFSTMGPRFGDYSLKPDLAAPGVGILAAKAGGTAETEYYVPMDGTSMATPHVAGAAAIVAQRHPEWTPGQLKDALMSTSKPLDGYTAYQVGAGRLDVAAGVTATVTATGSAYFGFQGWPHDDLTPIDRTVTYTNTGDAAVTLDLSHSAVVAGGPYDTDPGADAGTPAPAGLFALSGTAVTVPAHGTATVTVTADPGQAADGRRYLGQLVATEAGVTRARTQTGLYREDERHDLTFTVKDRAGRPAATFVVLQMLGVSPDPYFVPVDDSGRATIRLRAGTYSALSYLDVPGSKGPDSVGVALLGDPQITLDRDREVVLDGRKAREVTAVVPRRTEDRALYMDWYRSDGEGGVFADQFLLPAKYDSMFVLPTKQVTVGAFEYETRWRKAYPMLTVTDRGRPVTVLGQPGTSFYDGTAQRDAVYAGTGTPEEYAGRSVRGKLVLVTRSDAVPPPARAAAAAAAGAKLLVVVNDGPGKLLEWVGQDDGSYSPVPVASVTQRVGAPLIADAQRGKLRLGIEGVPNSPYVYDLVDPHPGRVPNDVTYRPKPSDLATVDVRFHGTTRYGSGEFRWDFRPYREHSFGLWHRVDMPGTRVDYVSAQPGTAWAESAVTGPELSWVSSADIHAYRPGSKYTNAFFGPVARPRDGGGFWSSTRYEGFIAFNVQPWSDGGAGHAGYITYPNDSIVFRVYSGGELLATSEGWASASLFPVEPEKITYTLDLDARRNPAVYRLSQRTHTVWDVVSLPIVSPEGIELMPVLQMDYRVDTDLGGTAKGGKQKIGFSASHLPGVRGGGRIVAGTLAVSFDDGVTWRPVPVTRAAGGGWTASFTAPERGYVSLRATARDDAGNTISQEVIRAYRLGASGHHRWE